ncbi:MAG: PQQ-dependent sugar dehydrogenase [Nocardioides sp.]
MRTLVAVSLLALTTGVLAPTTATAAEAEADAPGVGPRAQRAAAVPSLRVTREARGLAQPWDVQPIGNGAFLVTERDTARLLRVKNGHVRRIRFPKSSVWVSGETGLMSMEIDPGFARNGRFYTCQGGHTSGGGHDVKVVAWRLNDAQTRARRADVLLEGIQATSGRHGGCRLLIGRNGSLLVGTGDAAVSSNPRNLQSLNGKVLRLNRTTGAPWPANPYIDATNRKQRYVLNYGHRNIQGLATRRDGSVWSVEHGSNRDDEVNLVVSGGDYGWEPNPPYDESGVPMTDQSLAGDQIDARWSSGSPTIATSGATWVRGTQWGSLNGALAVAALKGSRVVFMKFNADGVFQRARTPAALRKYGRLRSISRAPNGDLIITTANGSGDSILRVHPRG